MTRRQFLAWQEWLAWYYGVKSNVSNIPDRTMTKEKLLEIRKIQRRQMVEQGTNKASTTYNRVSKSAFNATAITSPSEGRF